MAGPVIVGHEPSEQSADALAVARLLADASQSRIVVAGIHVVEAFVSAYAPELDKADDNFRASVEGAARSCGGEAAIMNSSSVARGLQELAEQTDAELVVLGSCHRGPLGRAMAGSVAKRLLHGSPCAVAVAPSGFRDRAAGLATIGVGVDGSDEAKHAVEEASRLAEKSGATVWLLGAGDPSQRAIADVGSAYGVHEFAEAMRGQFRGFLEEAAAGVARGVPTESRLLHGPPARALASEAAKLDLLVVGSRGYGPLRRVLLGSVSAHLVDSAPCPVLVVPRGAAKAGGGREESIAGTATS